jgi:GNAT superfamily N-acetyltransferase
MAPDSADPVVRVAGAGDLGALASLRARWSGGARADPAFERRMAEWLAADGDRRTTWLAMLGEAPAGMASILEYRRMPRPGQPDGRWGYVGTVFVREDVRGRGIGTALLHAVTTAADERRYARLVLSPNARSVALYQRAGFVVPDDAAGEHRLLVRPGRPR